LVTRSPTLLIGGGFYTGKGVGASAIRTLGEETGGRWLLPPRGIVRGRCARSFG